jgi:hypothetical protein
MKGSEDYMGFRVKEKQAIIREWYQQYQRAGKKEKTGILDEVTRLTGLNRTYLLHLPANQGKTTTVRFDGKPVRLKAAPGKTRNKRAGKVIYGQEAVSSLKALWAYFGFMCGRLPAPFMRGNTASLSGGNPSVSRPRSGKSSPP